jgi:hypothetical protein
MSQVKVFIVGAVLGVVFGATVLGAIAHFVLIGFAALGIGLVVHRGRRLVVHRAEDRNQLKT